MNKQWETKLCCKLSEVMMFKLDYLLTLGEQSDKFLYCSDELEI